MSNKALKIVLSSGSSVEAKSFPGLFDCVLKHKVTETSANIDWFGPKIPVDQWHNALSFMKWATDTENSEAQLRMFVHPEKGWLIHAFPQKGGTGMTTKELDNEKAKQQRAEIPDGYIAFGTVHSHCDVSAFQSGTDEADEKGQDGLHITIGKLKSKSFDIHCRFYLKGHKFEPNMSFFWDIGQQGRDKLDIVADLGFDVMVAADSLARRQMCAPPEKEEFPVIWKENYELPPKFQQQSSIGFRGGWDCDWEGYGHHHYTGHQTHQGQQQHLSGQDINGQKYCVHCSKMTDHNWIDCPVRLGGGPADEKKKKGKKHDNSDGLGASKECLKQVIRECEKLRFTVEETCALIRYLDTASDEALIESTIIDVVARFNGKVSVESLNKAMDALILEERAKKGDTETGTKLEELTTSPVTEQAT